MRKKRRRREKRKKKRKVKRGRILAAGRCNLPAVAVYWLMESCEAWYGKMGGGGGLAGQAGKNGIGWLEVEICSVKRMTADERLFPADAGSELAG